MLTCDATSPAIKELYDTAMGLAPYVTDKIAHHGGYEMMYGIFLMPRLAATGGGAGLKFLEIGLGCNYKVGNAGMGHTSGNSARLWRKVAPKAELWEAEYDGKCVASQRRLWGQLNVRTLVGDQGNSSVLDSWIAQSGGAYDVVIDDGSHGNADILASFDRLWPQVKPGGLYFLEDLQVGRHRAWDGTRGTAVVSDVLQSWTDQLLIPAAYSQAAGCYSRLKRPPSGSAMCPDSDAEAHVRAKQMRAQHPLPPQVAFVFCQQKACVVGKRGLVTS